MKNDAGVSLIELLIVTSIVVAAGVVLINMMVFSNNIFFNQTAKVNQGLSLNQASLEITEAIKSSAGIPVQYPPTGTAQFITDANTLILKIPSINSSGTVIDSLYDYAVIEADTQKPAILRKRLYPAVGSHRESQNKVLTTVLNDLVINYLDMNNNEINPVQAARIKFTIKLYESSGNQSNQNSISGTVNLKN